MANRPPRLYVDSCCFIDAVKQEVGPLPPAHDADVWYTKKLMAAHKAGEIQLLTSTLTVGECLAIEPGQTKVPADVQQKFRDLLTSGQYVSLASPSPKTADLIQKFRWEHELVLGSPDAIHFATAIEQGCSEFLSGDGRLNKPKIKAAATKLTEMKLRLIAPSQTLLLPDHYRQGTIEDAQSRNASTA